MNKRVSYSVAAGVATAALALAIPGGQPALAHGPASDPPLVFLAAGPTAASIQSAVDAFRAALGGVNNGNVAGPLATGRREINWDGGGSTATSEAPTPFEGFLVTRGALFSTPGTGFVQAPASGLATVFANPSYETIFQAFSPVRLFSPVGSNRTEVKFFVPGGAEIKAGTAGFGAVFSDVDQPDGSGAAHKHGARWASTFIEMSNGFENVYSSFVPASPGTGGFSFLGVVFKDEQILRVRITSGDAAPGKNDTRRRDIVMMDDFIYAEPQPQK